MEMQFLSMGPCRLSMRILSPQGAGSRPRRKEATLAWDASEAGLKQKNRVLLCLAARCSRCNLAVCAASNQHSRAKLVLCCKIFSAAHSVSEVLSERTQSTSWELLNHC